MESWPQRFVDLFEKTDKPLAEVFNAGGLREMWLQGEFYRHFKALEGFEVNHSFYPSRIKHDLYSKSPKEMIAEIKVYGLKGFQAKNLDGSSVKNYKQELSGSPNKRIYFDKERIEKLTGMGEGTYLSDVRRLHIITQEIEKYMILVLRKDDNPDDFGDIIKSVQVSNIEYVFDKPNSQFFVRISQL